MLANKGTAKSTTSPLSTGLFLADLSATGKVAADDIVPTAVR